MMKLGRRDVTVSRPERNPSTTAVTRGRTITTTTMAAEGVTRTPPFPAAHGFSNNTPHRHAANSAMYPTDKSISPHSMTKVRPAATIPRTAPCSRTCVTVPG
jgi:hypothetical protein